MVQLELPERVERPIALFPERKPFAPLLVEGAQPIVGNAHRRLTDKRPGDIHGAGGGEQAPEEQCPAGGAHALTPTARS